MSWALANPNAQQEREAFARFEQPIPDDLWPPDFVPGAAAWFNAFWELSSDRQVGQAVGPIQYSSLRLYTHGWPPDEVTLFTRCIRRMDQLYLDHVNKTGKNKKFTREMLRGGHR